MTKRIVDSMGGPMGKPERQLHTQPVPMDALFQFHKFLRHRGGELMAVSLMPTSPHSYQVTYAHNERIVLQPAGVNGHG